MNTRVLIVDDDPIVADSLAERLAEKGYDTLTAHDGQEAIDVMSDISRGVNVLVTDMNMPRVDGLSLLREMRVRRLDVVPVVITGFGKIDDAVEAVKLGAVDYLTKPLIDTELLLAVGKAANQQALLAENTDLKRRLDERFGVGCLIGADRRMLKVYDLIEAVADSRTTVLVTGESGTGKSVVGGAVHQLSPRSRGPFVTFACGSIPETLLESELFGHVKGAFTGAESDKQGRLASADKGTLFIDEINSATPALQLKLLRVLQDRCFEPVGSTQTRKVDVRFVLAANEDLSRLVKQGRFREDLFYRINVVHIEMPALRQRPGDIVLLAEHFVQKHCEQAGRDRRLSVEAMELLQRYDWPGNVRELENAIEHAVVLSRHMTMTPDDLPETLRTDRRAQSVIDGPPAPADGAGPATRGENVWTPMPLEQALWEPERRILLSALRANHWNRNETARQLQINRTTLYKKIRQFGLQADA